MPRTILRRLMSPLLPFFLGCAICVVFGVVTAPTALAQYLDAPPVLLPIVAKFGAGAGESWGSIAGGYINGCAVNAQGGAVCWGDNGGGQLGSGSGSWLVPVPVPVSGLERDVVAVSVGVGFSCALTRGGGVKCWGMNNSGQLGNGQKGGSQSTPVDVVGLNSGVVAISAGAGHACALTAAGAAKCWGENLSGRLGDGTITTRLVPTNVVGLSSGVVAIHAGLYHSCAVTVSGAVKCWGDNRNFQVGSWDDVSGELTPYAVPGLDHGFVDVQTGNSHTCALSASGGVKCWGSNGAHQIGNGMVEFEQRTPADVYGLKSGVIALSAGGDHNCALTADGTVYCWGSGYYNPLGSVPLAIQGLKGVVAIAASGSSSALPSGRPTEFTCARMLDGEAKCWGGNERGQLGDRTTTDRYTPAYVGEPRLRATQISAGGRGACAVITGGAVRCWGEHAWSEPDFEAEGIPKNVVKLSADVKSVARGSAHACALTSAGGVKCWGQGGQLGDGTDDPSLDDPVDVIGLQSGVMAIVAGGYSTCALTASGSVQCWGSNIYGQLGDGTKTHGYAPVAVSGLDRDVVAIGAGTTHACAVTRRGALMCWGYNYGGQLGTGSCCEDDDMRLTPTAVVGLESGVVSVSGGDAHTCVVMTSGGVKCWGLNSEGQLGDGTNGNHYTPVDVPGLASGVTAISAGALHTCALTATGGVHCWGYNESGMVGDGTTVNRNTPVQVSGLEANVAAIDTASAHTCALMHNGRVACWGYNAEGALGNGLSKQMALTPMAVVGLGGGLRAFDAPE